MEVKDLGTFDEKNSDVFDILHELWYSTTNDEVYFAHLNTKEGKKIKLSPANYPDVKDFFTYHDKESLNINLKSPMKKEEATKVESIGMNSIDITFELLVLHACDRENVFIEYTSPYQQTKGQVIKLYSADYCDVDKVKQYARTLENELSVEKEESKSENNNNSNVDNVITGVNMQNVLDKAKETGYSIDSIIKIEKLREEIIKALEKGNISLADELETLLHALISKESMKVKNSVEKDLDSVVDKLDNYQKKSNAYKKLDEIIKMNNGKNISSSTIINGLKFIAEHPLISQDELVDGLIKLGCTFSFDDIRSQFPDGKASNLLEGMKIADMGWGATVIANFRGDEVSREMFEDDLLGKDDETSIYNFIRVATGDMTYTKDNIDALNNSEGRHR